MSDREPLLRAVCAHPDEDTPRLAFADWLDEHSGAKEDREWAQFIRAQIKRERSGLEGCEKSGLIGHTVNTSGIAYPTPRCRCKYCQIARVEWEAGRRCGVYICGHAVQPVTDERVSQALSTEKPVAYVPALVEFERGFPAQLRMQAWDFVRFAGAIFARCPITSVVLLGSEAGTQGPSMNPWFPTSPLRTHRWFDAGDVYYEPVSTGGLPHSLFVFLPGGLNCDIYGRPSRLYKGADDASDAANRASLKFGRTSRDRLWSH